jgi:uncharacterized damage-inducible protein DinB
MSQVKALIRQLQAQMNETLDKLYDLPDALLDAPVSHRCSMGRGLRGLLVHNLEHERMHLGQVATQRYYLHEMQLATMSRLLAEWYRERANLISLLIGLPDEALDARSDREEWTIRQMVEHVLYYEKVSVDAALAELQERAKAAGA